MPTPAPELLERLAHLSEAEQLAWLDRWSRAVMSGEPEPLPPVLSPVRRDRPRGAGEH